MGSDHEVLNGASAYLRSLWRQYVQQILVYLVAGISGVDIPTEVADMALKFIKTLKGMNISVLGPLTEVADRLEAHDPGTMISCTLPLQPASSARRSDLSALSLLPIQEGVTCDVAIDPPCKQPYL